MPLIKFTVNISGDTPDEVEGLAVKEATEFFKDLPGKFRVKEFNVNYDAEFFSARVSSALKAAQEKYDALPEEDKEGVEVVPDRVAKYDAWVEFEYDTNQPPKRKTIGDVWAEGGSAPVQEPANNEIYQDKYEEAQLP